MTQIMPLQHGDVTVRLLRKKDARQLDALLRADRSWLQPWEATVPGSRRVVDARWMVAGLLRAMRDSSGLPLIIEFKGQLVGQVNVANILYGSVGSGTIGYWISREFAGLSITPKAVALTIDYLLLTAGLHRVEIDIRPENAASLRVVEKLGLRLEGKKERFIHIDGQWRDHLSFAVTREELNGRIADRV